MYKNWGLNKLDKHEHHESIDETDLHLGGHGGFQVRSGHDQLPWGQFKQEVVQDRKGVAVAQHPT